MPSGGQFRNWEAGPDSHCACFPSTCLDLALIPRNIVRDARFTVVAAPSLLACLVPLVVAQFRLPFEIRAATRFGERSRTAVLILYLPLNMT